MRNRKLKIQKIENSENWKYKKIENTENWKYRKLKIQKSKQIQWGAYAGVGSYKG